MNDQFHSWKMNDGGMRMAGPTYGVGKNGPRFIVSTDSLDDLAHLVDALNAYEEQPT